MPLLPQPMQVLIQAKAGSQLMAGNKLPSMVAAIVSATCQYLMLAPIVNSTNTVLGPGIGTQMGRIDGLVPMGMTTWMMNKSRSKLLSGRDTEKLYSAISTGVVNSLNAVIIQGTVMGGGPGSGTGRISNLLPSVLTSMIMAQEAFRLLGGSKLKDLISSVAFGICTYIQTFGVVNIINIGVVAPPPVVPVLIQAPGIGRFV